MEYRQLYYFICVAEEKNYTHAAQKLHVSQPSLSKSITNLENELGVQLISRSTRKFQLTPDGQAVYIRAKSIVENFEALENFVSEIAKQPVGHLRMGIPPVLNTLLAPILLSGFLKVYPQIELDFAECSGKVICDKVYNGDLDIGVLIKPINVNKFDQTEINADKIVLAVSLDSPLAKRKKVSIGELKHEKFIMLNEGFHIHEIFLKACNDAGFVPNIYAKSQHWDFLLNLVIHNVGVTVLPRPILALVPPTIRRFKMLEFKEDFANWEVVAITKKGIQLPYTAKILINYLKATVTF